jgi:hypothetical protein
VGKFEYRTFVEIDRDTEHIPAIVRKAALYDRYYRSGREQSRSGIFPSVLFVTKNQRRVDAIERSLRQAKKLTPNLFAVTDDAGALDALIGAKP